jgi:hypothetical protein
MAHPQPPGTLTARSMARVLSQTSSESIRFSGSYWSLALVALREKRLLDFRYNYDAPTPRL